MVVHLNIEEVCSPELKATRPTKNTILLILPMPNLFYMWTSVLGCPRRLQTPPPSTSLSNHHLTYVG